MGPWHSRPRAERVRFGVSLDQVCKHDIIPGPLLAMVLKLNKEAPFKKNVFRAPGHEATVKKVICLLQRGYAVDVEEISVYTIASIVKKFLRKIPNGIFGLENEDELFGIMDLADAEERFKRVNRIMTSLSLATQRLLVLLFGTFRAIADCATWADTGMTSEALGVSVAPSVFRSCVSGGKTATMEDVIRFKMATRVTKYLIDYFGHNSIFNQPCYEYYTKMTGRPRPGVRDWRRGIYTSVSVIPGPPVIPHRRNTHKNDEQGFQSDNTPSSPNASSDEAPSPVGSHSYRLTLAELKTANRHAESTRDLSYLPQVHERQTARLRSRLEWYGSPGSSPSLSFYPIKGEEKPLNCGVLAVSARPQST